MQYISIDEMEHFSFHDAELISIDLLDQSMKWVTKHINATTENTQNSHPTDMCVAEAEIVFETVEIKSIIFCEYKMFDSNHKLVKHEKPREAPPCEFDSILRESLSAYCWINGMHTESAPTDGKHKHSVTFSIDGGAGFFDMLLVFDRVVISWDKFDGKAWYVDAPWNKQHDS